MAAGSVVDSTHSNIDCYATVWKDLLREAKDAKLVHYSHIAGDGHCGVGGCMGSRTCAS